MTLAIFRVIHFFSIAACVIVLVSFGVFALDQTKGASTHQQEELSSQGSQGAYAAARGAPASGAPASAAPAASGGTARAGASGGSHESGPHAALTEAFDQITSPFAGIVSSSSEWTTRGARVLFALLVYGFGLGYLARIIRVRV